MQGSDRGFGKVKSLLKSSFSDCVTVGLLFRAACVLLSSTYCSGFLVGVLSTLPPVTRPVSLNVCLQSTTIVPTQTGYRPGGNNLHFAFDHWSKKNFCKISSHILWKRLLFLSSAELLARHTGKQRRLFIIMCQAMACSGRRCCWPWVKIELLSLAVLIDSWVFISNVEGSISSISRGFTAAAMAWLISVFRSSALSLSPPFYSQTGSSNYSWRNKSSFKQMNVFEQQQKLQDWFVMMNTH